MPEAACAPAASLQAEVVRSSDELEALAPEWTALWQRDANATPFQHPAWLLPWWHSFGTAQLRTLVLRDGSGALQGLVPLYIHYDSARGERQLLLVGAGTSDYLDGIFAPECAAEELQRALPMLRGDDDWDVAYLTQLRKSSPLLTAVRGLSGEVQEYAAEHTSVATAVPVRQLPRKVRADVLYHRNAASGRGRLQLHVADENSCAAMLEELIAQHSARWRAAGESGVLADAAVLRAHRESVPLLERAGLLRLFSLSLDNAPLASLYALADPPDRTRRTAYLYLNGYDPAEASLQPGTLLQAMATEHLHGEGSAAVDMLRGDEAYKANWHATRVETYGVAWRPR